MELRRRRRAAPYPFGGMSVAANADPWQFLLRLNQILAAELTPIAMMQAVMKAMHEVPEIEASWIAKPDADGSVTPLAWSGTFARTGTTSPPGTSASITSSAH